MSNGLIGGANARGKPGPKPRPAAREISTQTPSEMRRLMQRQAGKARGMLKSGRKTYAKG